MALIVLTVLVADLVAVLFAAHLTNNETSIIVAGLVAIAPVFLALANRKQLKNLTTQVKVPGRSIGKKDTSPRNSTNTIGEELHDLRQDVYELGQLLGSHLLHHQEPKVALNDLTAKQEQAQWNKDKE